MIVYHVIFWTSIAVLIYIYIGYALLICFLSLFVRKPLIKDCDDKYLPRVSIILAAYNEAAHIEMKIKNCLSLDYPKEKLQIIIGSDGSDDGTNEIVERYVGRDILFFPHHERRGKMAVVNDGVRHANGEICVFSDISECFDCDAVRKLVRNFVDPSVGAVTGNHIYNKSASELGRGTRLYWRYQRLLQCLESRIFSILSCDGTIYACRRHLFVSPPAGTINDDKAVPLAIVMQGYRVIFEPEAIARGDVLPETTAFFKQKVRGQAGMYQIFSLFPRMFWPKNFLIWFIFMSHTVGPVIAPWFLVTLFFSNMATHSIYPYNISWFIQLVFYFSTVLGAAAQYFKFRIPMIHVPYFFVFSNAASMVGLWSYLFNIQKATWIKVE